MPAISRLFDFQAGTTIQSSQVDDELNQLISTINSLPDKDGVIQTNLNADLVDGFHANNAGGTNNIPVCVLGTIQTNLNADLLDGQHAADIAAAAFDVGTKLLFYQATVPGGWDLVAAPTDHVLSWKSGAVGGTTVANSWTIIGFTAAGTALTELQMPIHNHTLLSHTHDLASHTHGAGTLVITYDLGLEGTGSATLIKHNVIGGADESRSVSGNTGVPSTNTSGPPSTNQTSSTGGTDTHTHTISSAGTWRPPVAYIIIGSKA